jgi:DNA-binding NarL/FixJ family response regulator
MANEGGEGGGPAILVVEDEVLVAMEIEFVLQEHGFTVVGTAASHHQALWIAERTGPTLALVDMRLADGFTGPEVVRDLAALNVPTVIVSGNCPEGAHDGPAIGCLNKPFTEDTLVGAVRAALAIASDRDPAWLPSGFTRFGGATGRRRRTLTRPFANAGSWGQGTEKA